MSQQTSQSNQQTSRQELLLKLAELQRAIQKWHNALRRQTGDIAANPITGQGRVLSVLAESGDMPQRDMSSRLGITPQSLGEMLVKLERAGYITREATGTGAHTLSVSITDAGRERVDKHGDVNYFDDFSDEEIQQFADSVDRAIEDLNRKGEELKAANDAAGNAK